MNATMQNDVNYNRFLKLLVSDGKSSDEVGLALFGLGRAGTIQLQNILLSVRARPYYIVEKSGERQKAIEAKYGHKLSSTQFVLAPDSAKVFADKNVQAVIVCTPTLTHREIVCQALAAGKHVFCEKPLAESDAAVRDCYEQARLHGVKLFCAFNRRYDPGLRIIKNKITQGDLGELFLVKTTARDSPTPSLAFLHTSGGIFHDCAVHDIDLVCWLMNEKPIRVQVFGSLLSPALQELRGKDFDTVTINLQFGSGKLATIDLSRNACYGYDQRCEVFGSLGMLQNGPHHPNAVSKSTATESARDPIMYSFPSRYHESYQIELEYFLDLVTGQAQEEVFQEDVLAVTKIATACETSAKEGRIVEMKY